MASSSISLQMLHTYHGIDREVFSRLVITIMRNPAESLLVMATWLWLEEKGFPNIIAKMTNLSDPLVNVLADEAVSCLNSLESNGSPVAPDFGLPFTSIAMEKDISLGFFLQNRFSAITGIRNFLNTICVRIFSDILVRVLGRTSQVNLGQPLVIPGFPHPIFGDLTVVLGATMGFDFPTGGLWGWSPINNISEDDRTMFLTFSRGFPVTGDEVKELFTRIYGDCVDIVHMQENVPGDEQPLFARLVLNSVAMVDQILNGRRIAKFRINGKHIWARKYERRE